MRLLRLYLHENVSVVNAYFIPETLSRGGHCLHCLHVNVSTCLVYNKCVYKAVTYVPYLRLKYRRKYGMPK